MGSGTLGGKKMGDEHKTPPKTVPEICIHIGYMREDLREIKNAIANSPSRGEFEALEERVEKIEGNIGKVVWSIVLAFIAAIGSLVFNVTNK